MGAKLAGNFTLRSTGRSETESFGGGLDSLALAAPPATKARISTNINVARVRTIILQPDCVFINRSKNIYADRGIQTLPLTPRKVVQPGVVDAGADSRLEKSCRPSRFRVPDFSTH